MSNLDPRALGYLKSARSSTTDVLAAMRLAHIMIGINVTYHPTDEGQDMLAGVREIISDLQSALDGLDWCIDGRAGEEEE